MIKIAYIIDSIATPGAGTENQLLLLLEKLDRTRFEPHLICLRPSTWLEENRLAAPVTVIPCRSMKSPAFPVDLWRLTRHLKAGRFQIAQTFFVDGNIYGTTAAHFARVPVIISSRRNIGYWHDRLQLLILRFLRRWTSHYLANSQAVVEKTVSTEGVDRSRLSLIYNGLDLSRFPEDSGELRRRQRKSWGIADSDLVIGCVANLRPVKNIDALIRAAAALAVENQAIRLVVAGEGDRKDEYQALIDEFGLGNRFHLVGGQSDIAACLAAFDIAALASHSESFSNALIEYMAAGKPIVASAVGGNVEAVVDGRTGVLFDPAAPGGLQAALGRLISDRELAARLGRAARQEALATYAWQNCIAAHERLYASLAGEIGA